MMGDDSISVQYGCIASLRALSRLNQFSSIKHAMHNSLRSEFFWMRLLPPQGLCIPLASILLARPLGCESSIVSASTPLQFATPAVGLVVAVVLACIRRVAIFALRKLPFRRMVGIKSVFMLILTTFCARSHGNPCRESQKLLANSSRSDRAGLRSSSS